MNFRFFDMAIINLDPDMVATGLEIGFNFNEMENACDSNLPTVAEVQTTIEDVVDYWCSSRAITKGAYRYDWINEYTIRVLADFEDGGFKGDLTHRNAITYGDRNFKIGLARLFHFGYITRKPTGGVRESAVTPVYIRVLYNPISRRNDALLEYFRKEANSRIEGLIQCVEKILSISKV